MGILFVTIGVLFLGFIAISCVIGGSRKEMRESKKVIDDFE